MDKVFAKIAELRPSVPDTLYHYCKAENIKYLVHKDSDIWCTHCSSLNDKSECWTGQKLFLEYIKSENILTGDVYRELEFSIRCNSLFNKIYHDCTSPVMPFTFSFSESTTNSDYFWEQYTDSKGGYRIDFNGKSLEAATEYVTSVISAAVPSNRMSIFLAPCFYEIKDREAIKTIFHSFVDEFNSELDTLRYHREGFEVAGRKIITGAAVLSPLIKAEEWAVEKEWRLIMTRDDYNKLEWRNNRVRSYMSAAIAGLRGLIKNIEISPRGDQHWLKCNLQYESNDGFR